MLRPALIAFVLALVGCDDNQAGVDDDTFVADTAIDTVADTAVAADSGDADSGDEDTAATDSVVDTTGPDTATPDATVIADTSDAPDTREPDTAVETSEPDTLASCPLCSQRRPIVLVHGINGKPADFDVMAARLIADGWPADWIVRFEAVDPGWTCNVDNAAAIAALVEDTRARTCQQRVDIVAHSMGTLSSRYYLKNLGGSERVNTYVTLGGMHHGLFSPCLAPEFLGVCVWQELCQSGAFIAALNADPATPGATHWVSIYGTADTTVPNDSSHLDGAENIVIEGAEHFGDNGLNEREDVYAEVKRVLGYDCW